MKGDCDTAPAEIGTDEKFAPLFQDAMGGEIATSPETWLTVEVCVRPNTAQAAQLKEVCAEMFRRGLPVYVSVSKRGTPFRAG